MNSLYIIANEYKEAAERLSELDLDAQTIADTLESLSGDLEVKATNVAMFVRNLEAQAEAIKTAEQAMAARRKSIENRAESIKQYLHANMERTGISKIECPYFTLAIKKNPAAVVIIGPVPVEFLKAPKPPEPAPDKTAIKEFINAGNAPDWAKLEQGTRLEIK